MKLNLCKNDEDILRTHLKVTHIYFNGKYVKLTPRWSAILRNYLLDDTIEDILHPKVQT